MQTATLTSLVTTARQLAGFEGTDELVPDSEVQWRLRDAVEQLWNAVAESKGAFDFLGKTAAYTGSGPLLAYPADFRAVCRILPPGQNAESITMLQPEERSIATEAATPLDFVLEYIPRFASDTELQAGSDTFTFLPGWARFVTSHVASELMARADEDAAPLQQRASQAFMEVMKHAALADRQQAMFVRDTRFGRHDSHLFTHTLSGQWRYRLERGGIRFFLVGLRL